LTSERLDSFRRLSAAFAAGGERYGRLRPGYPDQAVTWLVEGTPAAGVVVDVWAGTGKLTAGLPDDTADLITFAQSWHWVEPTPDRPRPRAFSNRAARPRGCGTSSTSEWRGSLSWPRSGTPWRVRKRSMRLDMRPCSARPSGRWTRSRSTGQTRCRWSIWPSWSRHAATTSTHQSKGSNRSGTRSLHSSLRSSQTPAPLISHTELTAFEPPSSSELADRQATRKSTVNRNGFQS
jgi:hypothetical protein